MIPRRISGFTHALVAPTGWNEATDGNCCTLHVRMVQEGGHVIGRIGGHQQGVRYADLMRGGGLQVAEQGVRRGIRSGQEHAQPAEEW